MISQGLAGPKGIPKGGPDGQMVNIPSPLCSAKERRSVVFWATYWLVVRGVRKVLRQIRAPLLRAEFQAQRKAGGFGQRRFKKAHFQENLLSFSYIETVPQTDTGGVVEKTKTNE